MERRVEHRHLRDAGERRPRHAYAGQVDRIVQRRERRQLLDGGDHAVVDEHRLREALAAVHDAVPDRDGVEPRPLARERVHDRGQPLLVRGEALRPLVRRPGARVVLQPPGLLADALHQAAGRTIARAHVHELVLDRGGTRVQDEDAPGHVHDLMSAGSSPWSRV